MPAASSSARKLNVFISYSRQDMVFVDRLEPALKSRGFEPAIDRSDIKAFEEWWERIKKLIEAADTIVYVVSPDSVTSEVALKEIAYAAALNKRFAPIVCRRVRPPDTIPDALAKLHFIFFDDPAQFEAKADELAEGLVTNLAWIRQHTEFGEAERRWSNANRANGLLLRSPALESAEQWIASRPANAPAPTEETQAFIRLSRQAASRRRNVLTGSLAAGLLLALGLAGLAFWQRTLAVEQRDASLIAESRVLADAAYRSISDGDAATGILLALEGLPSEEEGKGRPVVKETENMLLSGLLNLRERAVLDIRSVAAVSPNGGRLAHATADNTVEGIDIGTKEKLAALRHDGEVKSIAFSADGSRLVTLANDPSATGGLIRIWDLAASREVLRLKSYAGFNGVSLSPDGRKLLLINGAKSDGPNHGAMVWDTVTLARLLLLPHPRSVIKAAYSPDGRLLATATGDGDTSVGAATIEDDDNDDNVVRVFDAVTGARRHELKGARGTVQALAISPDNSLLVAASGDGIAYVWRLSDGKLKYRLWHADAPWGAGFLGGGASIVTTAGGTISVWDAQTGKSLEPHAAYIKPMLKGIVFTENGLAFDAKRKVLVTTHIDDTARLWDLSPAAATVLDPKCPRGSALLRVSRDGSRIIVRCGESGVVQVWDAARESKVLEFAAPRRSESAQIDAGTSMLLSPDGKLIALTDVADPVGLWSVSDGRKLASLPSGSGVLSATFDEQGRKLAVASAGGEVKIWDLQGPQSDWAARAPLILSAPGASVSAPKANVATPEADITARSADVAALAFSPTGDRLLTLSIDATPRIWETATGKLLLTLSDPDHTTEDTPAFLLSCAFSPDGRFVATYATGVLEVWEAASGKRLFPVPTGPPLIVKLEFSADGRRVMSAPGEGYMLNVEVPSGREMRSPANNADKAEKADNASLGGAAYDREAEIVAVAETDLQGGKDASLRLRDGRTFRGIWGFKGFYDDWEFSAGGRRLTAVALDGVLHTWTFPPRGPEGVRLARRLVPRCLGTLQREEAGLDPAPPRWCVTGPDNVAEKDPSRWQGKWPYNRIEWRDWLVARDRGESRPWPN